MELASDPRPPSRPDEAVDVLVVGAGPVGLCLAIGLRRHGVGVRVVDRSPAAKREARAAVVWPRMAEVLADLGAAEHVTTLAHHLDGADVHASGRRLGRLEFGGLDSAFPRPLAIEQNDIESALVEALAGAGVRVEWGRDVMSVTDHGDHVVAEVRGRDGTDCELVRAAWAVGCEGATSVVREAAGIPFEGRRRPNLQIVQMNATARWDLPYDRRRGWFFLAPGASLGVMPLPGGWYRFFCFMTDPDPSVRTPPTPGEMAGLVSRLTGRDVTLAPSRPLWANRARFSDRLAARLRSGRLLVAGDAAHVWAPIGGHGMNAGVRGAHNLAWKLAAVVSGDAHATLLDTYSDEQLATARHTMREMNLDVLERPLPSAMYWPIRALLPIGLSLPPAQRAVERTLSDLDRHHRCSKLSVSAVAGPGPAAGERVPGSVVVDGRTVRTHERRRYDRWTLVTEPATDVAALQHALGRYRLRVEHLRVQAPAGAGASLGRAGEALLVRPDGHVGLRLRADDPRPIDGYLAPFVRRRDGGVSETAATASPVKVQ